MIKHNFFIFIGLVQLLFLSNALAAPTIKECIPSASYRTIEKLNSLYPNLDFVVLRNEQDEISAIQEKNNAINPLNLISVTAADEHKQKNIFQNNSLTVETNYEIPTCKIISILIY